MWTLNDFEDMPMLCELYTLEEFIANCCASEMYLDEATETALYNYFSFRKVGDNQEVMRKDGTSVTLFEAYFKRTLVMYAKQYLDLLRVQTIEFDPMVTNYLERLVNNVRSNAQSKNTEVSNVSTGNTGSTTKTTDSRKGNETGNRHSEDVGNHNVTTDNDTTTVTSDSGTVQSSSKTDRDTKTNDTNTHDGTHGDRQMQAELPQSATGAGAGLPSDLNWAYATRQQESDGKEKHTDKHDGTVKDSETGSNTQQSTNSGTQKNTGTVKVIDIDETNRDENTNINRTETGESSTQGNVQTTQRVDNTGKETNTGNETGETKERLSGRNASPASLLTEAREYVMRTNAWVWLTNKLDKCFMDSYNY